jgi:hypothetical protein
MNSFTQKKLRVTLIMAGANSVFPGTNSNTLVMENLRVAARVQGVARLATQADIRIYGMKAVDMDALTVAWANPPVVLDHLVILEADNGGGFRQVFKGTIVEAQPDYQSMPDVSFSLLAVTGYSRKINPAEPTSYPAAADIDTIAAGFATQMDFSFVNGGAFGVLSKGAYFWGTLWDQLTQACEATNTDFYVFGDTLLITAAGEPATVEDPTVILTPQSGLIGYPSYERSGLSVSAIFDPAFTCGTPLEIHSATPSATGRWYPYSLTHILEAKAPRGQWLSQMQCLRVLA